MGDDTSEAVCVTLNPICHISAVAGSSSSYPRAVHVGPFDRDIDCLHLVFIRGAAPVALDGVHEFESESGRTMKVRLNHDVSGGSKQLGVPAIVKEIIPGAFGTSVHE